jgi:hypothetical protein
VIKLLLYKDTNKSLASGFFKYHEAKGTVCANKRFDRYICVCLGINMDAHIPLLIIDRKESLVMSAHYRTSRVTRLRIINLLSTRKVGSMIELHRKSFKKIKKNQRRKTGNVSDLS